MLLRKLEAYGFKSFAEKTELEFGQGITAIVGPNGSGKSNISDAIRWALGEQSIRTLRGAKMEDVIFAGSTKRRPLGVAEVSLCFDNSDGVLPLDFNEVIITRRVFRSGDSEYYINKSPCRLKDIHDLLADTGLGRDSMTVIGQNKIDELLNTKPEERRLIFEEAAGITRYKHRKKESLKKLDDTEQNLVRVRDLMSELEQQIGPLFENAKRTAKYNELNTELTACQVTILLDKYKKAEKMLESAKLELASLNDAEIATNTKLITLETEKERLVNQLADYEQIISDCDSILHKTGTEIERVDGKMALLEERMKQGYKENERLQGEQLKLVKRKQHMCAKLQGLELSSSEKTAKKIELQDVLQQNDQKVQEINQNITLMEKNIEEAQEKSFGHLQDVVNAHNNLRTLERDVETSINKQASLEKEHNGYLAQKKQLENEYQLLIDENRQLSERLDFLNQKSEEILGQKSACEQKLSAALQEEQKTVAIVNDASSRLKILTSMQQQYEGFAYGIKSVLKSTAPWRSGVCGAVAQILTVPDKFVTAVEIALGSAMQNVITENDEVAKQAINYLKQHNLGRATFLPLNTLRISRPKENEVLASREQGILGFASQLISCEERFRPVVEFLLGRTIVAETIDDALKIARKNSFALKIVTLEGELVNPGGTMSGGSAHRKEASFLSRSNEIQTIGNNLETLKDKHSKITADIEAHKGQLASLAKLWEEALNERQGIDVRHAQLKVHCDKLGAELKRVKLAVDTLYEEINIGINERESLQEKIQQTKDKVAELENRDNEHKALIIKWQQQLKQLQEEKDKFSNIAVEIKISIANLKQELSTIHANLTEYETEVKLIEEQIDGIEAELANAASQVEDAKKQQFETTEMRELLIKDKAKAEEERRDALNSKSQVLIETQKLDAELKNVRRKSTEIQNRLHEIQLIETKYGYEVNYSHEQIKEQYGLQIEEAENLRKAGNLQELTVLSKKLEQQIAELGPVNPAAIEEYNRTKERYDFFVVQLSDLEAAKNYLTSVIKDIDKTMAKQFTLAFETINGYFGDIFVRLFGGGKAYLSLLEPENILETGIDVIVQPPGKKLQNLALLSGGERAMTVIALLFSFLRFRPAPFCVLDEIDAALDEANVNRFSEFLRDYAQNTQFIIVTHRKGTMEAANVMHGITMEEAGISRLVSVKFMDRAG